ncbi:uncharacterized protein [Drosophila tropicalis]|uniref:uncharacterized protein n=1 Tax=Drosophila tropicalis TaxID=46794 RepID=UPI0035AB85A5
MYIVLYLIFILIKSLETALVWNTEGEASIFIAIAVPIDLPRKEVFLSYNFMASYRLPKTWSKKPPIFRNGNGTNPNWDDDDHYHGGVADIYDYYDDFDGHEHHYGHLASQQPSRKPSKHKPKKPKPLKNKTKKKKKKKPKPISHDDGHKHKKKHKRPHPTEPSDMDDYKDFFEGFPVDGMGDPIPRHRAERSLLSRTKFYEILSQRFEQHDLGSGDSCLLRLICETNSYQLAEINGLLGHLIHIMFSPSSSHYEALPQRYYMAEMHGQRKGNCEAYHRLCKQSVLDLITQPVKQGK